MISIHTGDDVALAITLKQNGSTFAIDVGATVRAALVQDGVITGPTTCSPTADGADWSQSIVVAEFPAGVSVNAPVGRNTLEIEVNDNGVTTYLVPNITVIQDSIV